MVIPGDRRFNGTWYDVEQTMVVIMENQMSGNEGSFIDLNSEGTTCSFKSGDEVYKGRLQDDDHILWDDGEIWTRKGTPGAPSPLDEVDMEKELMQRMVEAVRQKRSVMQQLQQQQQQQQQQPKSRHQPHQGRPERPSDERLPPEMAEPSSRAQERQQPEREPPARADRAAEVLPPGVDRFTTGRPSAHSESTSPQQDRAREAFEAEKARKAAALERARANKQHQRQQEEPLQPPARAEAFQDAAAVASNSGTNRAKQQFEQDKARKQAALERARRSGNAASEATVENEFEQAKAKSDEGISRARKAFEEEKARKAAALERARAKAAAGKSGDGEQAADGGAVGRGGQGAFPAAKGGVKGGGGFGGKGLGQSAMGGGGAAQRAPAEEEYSPGKLVKIVGLTSTPELNGSIATLVKYLEDKQRWQARVGNQPSILIKPENMTQATASEVAAASRSSRSPAPPANRGGKGKGGGKDPLPQSAVEIGPDSEGNKFDVTFQTERSAREAVERLVTALSLRGVCAVEANAPKHVISAAYEEASALWDSGEFGPPLAHLEGQPEEKIWSDVLFQGEEKVFWIRDDLKGPRSMDNLKVLSRSMSDLTELLWEELMNATGLTFNHYWGAMLSCYTGNKTYNLHIDNPSGANESGVPDNGLRLSMCYYLNPFWSAEGSAVNNCGGGLDVHLTEPWETPSSLLNARKAPVMRIAPHADTLVCFLSQRMAHRVISTKGSQKWFALWIYCFDLEAKEKFDRMAGDLVGDVC